MRLTDADFEFDLPHPQEGAAHYSAAFRARMAATTERVRHVAGIRKYSPDRPRAPEGSPDGGHPDGRIELQSGDRVKVPRRGLKRIRPTRRLEEDNK